MSNTSTFAKRLASNDKPTRDAALESLQKYLKTNKNLTLLDLQKIWKGLYFSVWYCDRSKAQERLCESLGRLYSEYIAPEKFHSFVLAFYDILGKEWGQLDKWRIDKYYLLVRRVLRHNFIYFKKNNWDEKIVNEWVEVMEKSVLSGDPSVSLGLPYHLCDIFLDELEGVMFDQLQEEIDIITRENDDADDLVDELKVEVASEVPVLKIIEPFAKLNKSAQLKTLREKCKCDVLDDFRLIEWGVIKDENEEEEDEDSDDDEDEDEWNGF
ncbi:Ribosomal RNA-processing protein, putative (Ribosome biogenesis protein, putative) [Candida maltosa Xu316]|uniref:Ribosomal RNA-processing protein, putative (Ribosome biogenesis protein, putative) n=1 Tax=Candida maltosa (strain Xu316) TaxID=1245528 RepID=M3J0T3_CANMX|nr:Ribosomal RNA-processing protein, putative (Ribosome biogenesis protein, putative) [Candida maltosa Xu316]